jgi:hypothetical protein
VAAGRANPGDCRRAARSREHGQCRSRVATSPHSKSTEGLTTWSGPEPLCRLRYGGSAARWGFAVYLASKDGYEDAVLLTGGFAGAPRMPWTAPATFTSTALTSDRQPRLSPRGPLQHRPPDELPEATTDVERLVKGSFCLVDGRVLGQVRTSARRV